MSLKYEPASEPLHISVQTCAPVGDRLSWTRANASVSGDTTPCRMTGVTLHSGRDCVKSLRSSYTGLYPQTGRLEDCSALTADAPTRDAGVSGPGGRC